MRRSAIQDSAGERPEFISRDLTLANMFVRAETMDLEQRSVKAIITTDRIVRVYDWTNYRIIDEVLRTDGAVLPGQVSLLDTHQRWSIENMCGSVRELAAEKSTTVGRIYFAKEIELAEKAWKLVSQGHLRDVSAGYNVRDGVDIPAGQSAIVAGVKYQARDRILRIALRWQLREVSLTPVGADEATKIRGLNPVP